jgi:hypothetical protein
VGFSHLNSSELRARRACVQLEAYFSSPSYLWYRDRQLAFYAWLPVKPATRDQSLAARRAAGALAAFWQTQLEAAA